MGKIWDLLGVWEGEIVYTVQDLPLLYGTTRNQLNLVFFSETTWDTLALDDLLNPGETVADLQDITLDREYIEGIPTFLHSGWARDHK